MQIPYKYLLFDADNTIFDFDETEAQALEKIVTELGFEHSRQIHNIYHNINKKCWSDLERKKIKQEEIQGIRFTKFLNKLGSDANPKTIGDRYLSYLAQSDVLIEGATEVLEYCKGKYPMTIITNGLKEVQRAHFQHTGLTHFFDHIVVSDEIGVSKPNPAFFDYTFDLIGNPPKEEVLIIGDGLSSDITGGVKYGVDTCWFNKRQDKLKISENYKPTYQIDKITELINILEGKV